MYEEKANLGRQTWISCLRISSTLAVVWLHTNGTIYGNQELFILTPDQIKWFTVNYHLMKWAVPVFLMITGALLLQRDRKITIHECVCKYSRRQLLAILLFGTFYAAIIEVSSNGITPLIVAKSIWGSITGNTSSHLWYCFLLIGIYSILPVLKAFIDKADKKEILYLLIVLFVFDFFIPFINKVIDQKIQFNIPFAYAVFYLLCGYYMTQISKKARIHGIVVCVTMAIIILLSYFNSALAMQCLEYSSPIVALLAISLFGLFQRMINIKNREVLWKIDRLCFGVYLIHPVFIQAFYRTLGFTPMRFSIYQIGTVLIWGIVCLLSFGLSWIVNRISVMKKYIL